MNFYIVPKTFVRRLGLNAAVLLSEFVDANNRAQTNGTNKHGWFAWQCDEFFDAMAWTKEQFDDAYLTLRLAKLVQYDDGGFVQHDDPQAVNGYWFKLNFARISSMEQ